TDPRWAAAVVGSLRLQVGELPMVPRLVRAFARRPRLSRRPRRARGRAHGLPRAGAGTATAAGSARGQFLAVQPQPVPSEDRAGPRSGSARPTRSGIATGTVARRI